MFRTTSRIPLLATALVFARSGSDGGAAHGDGELGDALAGDAVGPGDTADAGDAIGLGDTIAPDDADAGDTATTPQDGTWCGEVEGAGPNGGRLSRDG